MISFTLLLGPRKQPTASSVSILLAGGKLRQCGQSIKVLVASLSSGKAAIALPYFAVITVCESDASCMQVISPNMSWVSSAHELSARSLKCYSAGWQAT